jgi:tRNA pseudouridine38-40 synthase
MVRVMVGTLMEVALRKQAPEWIGEVLEARDRCAAGQTAPAQGLTLWRVLY